MVIRYIFGDLRTGQILEEIPLFGVTMYKALNSDGDLRGTFQLDMTGKENSDLVGASVPGKTYVVAELNDKPMWGGIVSTRTYQANSKTIQLYCRGFEYYPARRFIKREYNFDSDQGVIFTSLWDDMQSEENGNLLVEVPNFTTGVTKTLSVIPTEYKTYGQEMDTLADGDDGFDWTIDVARSENVYRRILRLGYPTLGAAQSDNSVVLEYPAAILNYWETESIGSSGTNIYLVGQGQGEEMLQSSIIHNDLFESGWIEWDIDAQYKDVTSQNALDDLAVREGLNKKAPAPVIKIEMKSDLEPVFGGFGLGDYIKVVLSDPRHEPTSTQFRRLIRWEYRPASDEQVESAILTFEGDEDEEAVA